MSTVSSIVDMLKVINLNVEGRGTPSTNRNASLVRRISLSIDLGGEIDSWCRRRWRCSPQQYGKPKQTSSSCWQWQPEHQIILRGNAQPTRSAYTASSAFASLWMTHIQDHPLFRLNATTVRHKFTAITYVFPRGVIILSSPFLPENPILLRITNDLLITRTPSRQHDVNRSTQD